MSRRWTAALLLGLVAFATGCTTGMGSSNNVTIAYRWRGELWRVTYNKTDGSYIDLVAPWGKSIHTTDRRWPPEFRLVDSKLTLPPGAVPVPGARARAAEAAATPTLYMLDVAASERILIGNAATAEFLGQIAVPTRSQRMAISPAGDRLYVSHLDDTLAATAHPARITVIDTATRTIAGAINLPAGADHRDLAVSADGRLVYVSQFARPGAPSTVETGVLIIDVTQGSAVGSIRYNRPGATADRLVITPDGERIFAVATQRNPASLFAIDTLSRETVTSVDLATTVRDMLIDHTGTRLYFASDSVVLVVDTATTREIARIPVRTNARINALALSFDRGTLFANHEFDGRVTLIDTRTNRVVEELQIGPGQADGSYIAIVP